MSETVQYIIGYIILAILLGIALFYKPKRKDRNNL